MVHGSPVGARRTWFMSYYSVQSYYSRESISREIEMMVVVASEPAAVVVVVVVVVVVAAVVDESELVVVSSSPDGQGWRVLKLQRGPRQVSLARL